MQLRYSSTGTAVEDLLGILAQRKELHKCGYTYIHIDIYIYIFINIYIMDQFISLLSIVYSKNLNINMSMYVERSGSVMIYGPWYSMLIHVQVCYFGEAQRICAQ